jgi:hypothetical protein
MKVIWQGDRFPSYQMDFYEHALVILALRAFVASPDNTEAAENMLRTFEQIDEALRAIQKIAARS